MDSGRPPLLSAKQYDEPSRFQVENLLREARRQRRLPDEPVPEVCLLDPDGDVIRHLRATGRTVRHPAWACYHSELWLTDRACGPLGIVPCAVGAPYAVLVEAAWRDEGTSLHYLPPSEWSTLRPALASRLEGAFRNLDELVLRGASW